MSIPNALKLGAGHVFSSKKVILSLLLFSLALSIIPTVLLSEQIRESLDHSRMSEELASGYSDDWFQEFTAGAGGIGATFHPTAAGIGAILNGWDAFLSGRLWSENLVIVALILAYALVWVFVSGGLLAHFEQRRTPNFVSFVSFSATYFGRFIRLALIAGVVFWFLFGLLIPWMDGLIEAMNRNTIDERIEFAWVSAKYSVIVLVLFQVNLISDYSKILTVIQRRKSMILAVIRAIRLEIEHPVRTVGLYGAVVVIGLACFLFYSLVVPGSSQSTWLGVLFGLAIGQAYIATRIALRMLFFGSQLEMCRSLIQQRSAAVRPTLETRRSDDDQLVDLKEQ
jgi:hypothetical protein